MDLVTIKALRKLSHGYVNENGEVVRLTLQAEDIAEVPAADAKAMHDAGLVQVAVSDADKIQVQTDTQNVETQQNVTEQPNAQG